MVSTRLRSEIHAPSNGDNTATQDPPLSQVTAGTSNPVTTTPPVTLTLASSGTTTAAQTSIPMIFGTLPPLTNVVATATDHGTHYSTVVTTTRGPTDEYVVYTDDSSEDSERDYDIPPRRRRDGNQSRGSQHNIRPNNPESRRPTDQEYEARIRAYEQEIAQLKRDRAAQQARQPPPEPRQRTENPQNSGKLSRYTRDADRNPRDNDSRDRDNDDHDRRTEPRGPVINMISGGPTAAGLSSNSRKAYAREVMCIIGEPPKRAKTEIALTFDDSDLEGVKFPHDEPLVITLVIGNSSIKRVLVDNGASVDILFYDAYQKMGYADSQLTPSNMPIYGFNGVESKIEGMIQLPVTMGAEPRQATYMLNFMVIKASSTYNAILGRTGMHAFKAIASTYHLKIKFPTRNGVGEEKGDQKKARSCYVAALKPGGVGGQVLSIKELVPISLLFLGLV
nr:PREDICTED: uncharacterized protein LOC108198053 [Daucus carota subsp. sativus]